jgi:hypothetical protein
VIEGPAARFLATRREDLNRRFAAARRRWPALDGGRFASLLEETLPRYGADERVLFAAYDLALLHTGRDTASTRPAVRVLLCETLPRLTSFLAASPALAGALSNAVERMADEDASVRLAHAFAELGPAVETPEALLDAGALAAWRLGEARLRAPALARAGALPPRAVLAALSLASWPDAAAPLALRALASDGWRRPEEVFSGPTLEALAREPRRAASLEARFESRRASPLSWWTVAARVGDFTGFGGVFDAPPLVLDAAAPDRHTFFVTVGDEPWRVVGDCYGCVCRREESHPDASVRPALGTSVPKSARSAIAASGATLLSDGTLTANDQTCRILALAGASAFTLREDVLAASRVDSHRLVILGPPAEAV